MDNIFYQISDGRIWDVSQARYVEEVPQGYGVTALVSADGDGSEAYLIRTLDFYGHPLGDLALRSESGLKARLAALDAHYLTPRTMAGLATGDAVALERWQAHEAEAAPLRAKLAEFAESMRQEDEDLADALKENAIPMAGMNQ